MLLRALVMVGLVMLAAGSAAAATLDKMTCTQAEVNVLRFGTDRAQKRNAPAEIRFESNAMFAKDANGQQHEYPVQFISGPRYQAENWTMIFNPDLTSADVALVTMTDVQTAKWRCKKTP
jgi:hypothetical protein